MARTLNRSHRSIRRWALRWIMACVLGLSTAPVPSEPVDAEAMKAVFIFTFLKFVDWPKTEAGDSSDTFTICVVGDERLNRIASELGDKTAQGRRIVLANYARQANPKACHVVYISDTEEWRLKAILAQVSGFATLTVSDIPNFYRLGGMIGFVLADNRLGFEINQGIAQAARLQISAKLLALAKDVKR